MLLLLELDDVDAAAERAVEAGAAVLMPVAEVFWGERYGILRDPSGHRWALCTRREQLAPDEVTGRVPSAPSCGDAPWVRATP